MLADSPIWVELASATVGLSILVTGLQDFGISPVIAAVPGPLGLAVLVDADGLDGSGEDKKGERFHCISWVFVFFY